MDPVLLERRPLGMTGLSVSPLAMGGAKLGAFWQGRSPQAGQRALEEARRCGITFFDTADCYARGISERVIGRTFRSSRDDVVLATKVGLLKTPLAIASARRGSPECRPPGLADVRALGPGAAAASCFSPAYVERAAERSLRRLGTDRVDLLLLHAPPLAVLRACRFVAVLERLRQTGKIRHFGIACGDEEQARAALEVPGVACIFVPHNLQRPELVMAIEPEARRRGVALVAMAPFGDGTLLRREVSGHPPEAVAQGCLQFALATPGVASVLVGMSVPGHVVANVRAALAAPLAPAVVDAIRRSVAPPVEPGC